MKKTSVFVLMSVALFLLSGELVHARPPRGGSHGYHGHRGYYGHRHHTSFGFMFNMNPWYYPYYSYAYPYAYQAVVSAPIPTAYVQRSSDDAPDQQFWYYCTKPQGYFPYVRECQGKWQKVIPFPVETTP